MRRGGALLALIVLSACGEEATQEEARPHGYCLGVMRDLLFYYMDREQDPVASQSASEFDRKLQLLMGKRLEFYLTEGTSRSWWQGHLSEGKEWQAAQKADAQAFIDTAPAKCSGFLAGQSKTAAQ